ncbi:MAG: hypothetical protein KIT63_13460 [Rhodoferax sp.]|nr:hypothetical protein [Rhodoferax sp.]
MKIANKTITPGELAVTAWAASPVAVMVFSVSIRFMPAALAALVAGAVALGSAVALVAKFKRG